MSDVTAAIDLETAAQHRPWNRGWRVGLLVIAPFAIFQILASAGVLPKALTRIGEGKDDPVPFVDWANRFINFLRNDEILGISFKDDISRRISGWLEWPLELSERIFVADQRIDPRGWGVWIVLIVLAGVLGFVGRNQGRALKSAGFVATIAVLDQVIGTLPWVGVVAMFILIGTWLGGWRLGAMAGSFIFYLALFDVWTDSMVTLAFVAVAAPLATVIGWLLGLGSARSSVLEAIVSPFLNVLQAMPQLSYLLPIAAFVGIGDEAGLIAMIIFATAPMARLTLLGLKGVPGEVLDAGKMSGATRRQLLWKVELPSAKPALLVGVNQVIMQCFGMTVLASFVGMRGLGLPLLNNLQSLRIGRAFQLGVAIVLMAVTLDRLSQAAGHREPGQQGVGTQVLRRDPRRLAILVVALGIPAAIAAFGGLNWISLLEDLRIDAVGKSFPAFVMLTVFAMAMHFVAEVNRTDHDLVEGFRLTGNRRFGIMAIAIAAISIALARVVDSVAIFPEDRTIDTSVGWDRIVRWPRNNEFTRTVLGETRDWVTVEVLIPMADAFQAIPWIGLVALVAAAGWKLGGWRLALSSSVWIVFLAFSGLWVESMETLYLVVAALVLAVVIGIPLGIAAAATDRGTMIAQGILDTFQVLPSFIYLIPAVMLFSIGAFSALFAILIYAIVPAVRYTILGLRNVPVDKIEAAKTNGCTGWQTLWKVRMPIAVPEIMLGVNQVLNFGVLLVIIAAFIGGIGGLGDVILIARTETARAGESLLAGFCVVAMLIAFDQLVTNWSRQRKAQLGL